MVFNKNNFSELVCGNRDPLETPPPFMAKAILNFHFDYLTPSLISSKTSLLNNPKSMSECFWFEFKKKSSCIYPFGIWLFWGVLHGYIEECFIFFCFVICGVCLHVFWGGSKKVSIDTAGSVLSREKGPQATGAAGPDGKYRQRVNTKDSIAWAHLHRNTKIGRRWNTCNE